MIEMTYRTEQGILATAEQVQVGDTVYMGQYPVASSSCEPLAWRVLAKENDRILMITKACIDWRRYHPGGSVSWAHSDLRYDLQFLAEDLFTKAEWERVLETEVFTALTRIQSEEDQEKAEQTLDAGERSVDRLFLLSVYEAARYFANDSDRKCSGTPYAVSKGCYNNGEQNGACWWLRNCGYHASYAAEVLPWGEINGSGDEVDEESGVRPAMWVRLDTK
jgi:hypothetical protein